MTILSGISLANLYTSFDHGDGELRQLSMLKMTLMNVILWTKWSKSLAIFKEIINKIA